MSAMNRWDRYALIDDKTGDLRDLVIEALEYHKHNQSARVQAQLWRDVMSVAREVAALAEVEADDPE